MFFEAHLHVEWTSAVFRAAFPVHARGIHFFHLLPIRCLPNATMFLKLWLRREKLALTRGARPAVPIVPRVGKAAGRLKNYGCPMLSSFTLLPLSSFTLLPFCFPTPILL